MKLKLSYPVKPFIINQPFGSNGAYYQANGINIIGHNGVDLAARHGEPVYASHDGTAWYEVDDKQGHGVVLVTNEKYDYKDTQAYYKTIYWHLCDSTKEPQFRSPVEGYSPYPNTNKGLLVKKGDLIGYADTTGLSTGDHLHFGLKPMTSNYPSDYTNIEQNNGYLGAIDPLPYLKGSFDIDMEYGQTSSDIVQLQMVLQDLGYFPKTQQCTGYYGAITKAAVFEFQKDRIPNLSLIARLVYKGKYTSKLTRDALNLL